MSCRFIGRLIVLWLSSRMILCIRVAPSDETRSLLDCWFRQEFSLSDAVRTSNWQHWCLSRSRRIKLGAWGKSPSLLVRRHHMRHLPWSRTRLGDRSFDVAGPRLWNKLPASLRSSDSLCQFRRQLKTFLFVKNKAAAPSDSCFLGAGYKYSYLLTYLLTYLHCRFHYSRIYQRLHKNVVCSRWLRWLWQLVVGCCCWRCWWT